MSLHRLPTDESLAAIVPYGHFTDSGEVYLRGRGLMAAYEMRGLSLEASSRAELAVASEQLVRAFRHLGTNYMVQAIIHRLPATVYPERRFPSRAAWLIDDERRHQFAAENYWRSLCRLYIRCKTKR
jgi:type IV secretory pathway VirB4 component